MTADLSRRHINELFQKLDPDSGVLPPSSKLCSANLLDRADQGSKDTKADQNATAKTINLPEGAVNFNQGTLVGSFAKVAGLLDEAAAVPGTKGIMLTFDDFLVGLDKFGEKIQPLMKCRSKVGTNGSVTA